MTAGRIVNLYDLADAAYDAKEIREMSARLGHVALIDHNPRRGEKIEFSPAEARRYHERTAVERVNSHLHEEHGGRNVRVRGPAKVAAHLAFGLLVIAAEQMLRMLPDRPRGRLPSLKTRPRPGGGAGVCRKHPKNGKNALSRPFFSNRCASSSENPAKSLACRRGTGILPVFHGRDAHVTRGFCKSLNKQSPEASAEA